MISIIDLFLSYSSFGMFLFTLRHKFNIQWPCPSSMSIDKHPCDFPRKASHVTEARLSLWQKQRLAPLSKQTNPASAAGEHTGSCTGHQPRFSVGVCFLCVCVCVWQESRELMRQACGGPPALSQINHAADPVPSAWGPNRACMLSLSHGPGPLSSPQHNSSGVEGGLGGGTPQNALLPFLSSFSFCGHQEIDAGREKQKRPSHLPSAAAATTAPFYCLSEGPFGNGQALRGGGGGGQLQFAHIFWLVSELVCDNTGHIMHLNI